ncbi:MAG TPA: tyrosine-type recombinase/integrase, partial [Iamia sp.]|nr:tyrosine-type recombinase/integrase [Iamia sp.]
MRGHIQQRGGASWRIKVYRGRDESGRKRYAERTVRGSRRDAESELRILIDEVDGGRFVGSTISLDELLDRWLAVKRSAVAPTTLSGYEWISRRYIRPALGRRKVASLRPMDLDVLYSDLTARGLTGRTVRICHTVLRQSLEQARRWGFIVRSPAVDASPPPQRWAEVTPPTVDQVLRLIRAARGEDPAFATYLWVAAATGCRRGEVCALRWSDIDLDRSEMAVRRSIVHVGREVQERDTKTRRSRRLALDATLVSVLERHRLDQERELDAHGETLTAESFLFGAHGRPWRPDVVTNRFSRLRTTLGLTHVRLHDLR